MPFTDEELQELRAKLPRGFAIELAEEVKMKPGSVRNILSGTAKNDKVIVKAIDMLKEREQSVNNAKSALAS